LSPAVGEGERLIDEEGVVEGERLGLNEGVVDGEFDSPVLGDALEEGEREGERLTDREGETLALGE